MSSRRGVIAALGTPSGVITKGQIRNGLLTDANSDAQLNRSVTFAPGFQWLEVHGDGRTVRLTPKEIMDALEGK